MSAGGKAVPAGGEALGATAVRGRLARSNAGWLEPPEPGALRPLARALVDLALTLEEAEEESKPWTR